MLEAKSIKEELNFGLRGKLARRACPIGVVREEESSKRVLLMHQDVVHKFHTRGVNGMQYSRFDYTPRDS